VLSLELHLGYGYELDSAKAAKEQRRHSFGAIIYAGMTVSVDSKGVGKV